MYSYVKRVSERLSPDSLKSLKILRLPTPYHKTTKRNTKKDSPYFVEKYTEFRNAEVRHLTEKVRNEKEGDLT